MHKKLLFLPHALSGAMKAEIDSYVLRLARSVDRDNNRQGSIQDAAIGDKLFDFKDSSSWKIHFSRISTGTKSIKNLFFAMFWLTASIRQTFTPQFYPLMANILSTFFKGKWAALNCCYLPFQQYKSYTLALWVWHSMRSGSIQHLNQFVIKPVDSLAKHSRCFASVSGLTSQSISYGKSNGSRNLEKSIVGLGEVGQSGFCI